MVWSSCMFVCNLLSHILWYYAFLRWNRRLLLLTCRSVRPSTVVVVKLIPIYNGGMLGPTILKFDRQGRWQWQAGDPNLFQIKGQGQCDIYYKHLGFHMNIVLTFANISCYTPHVAICRNLNKYMVKLTTQLPGRTRTSINLHF